MTHFIVKCSVCDRTVSQCRCASTNKNVSYVVCDLCKSKVFHEALDEGTEMDQDHRSLLLYFECRAVDYGGTVDIRRMSADDMAIAKTWNESGYIRFGRISSADCTPTATHWCVLSQDAWNDAYSERRARNLRIERRLKIYRNGYDD